MTIKYLIALVLTGMISILLDASKLKFNVNY